MLTPHSQDYAATIAQIVPVLLLAALALPIGGSRPREVRRSRAGFELALTASILGAAGLTEYAALFGVWHGGLSSHDLGLLTSSLALLGLLTMIRLVSPTVTEHAHRARIPERRVWNMLAAVSVTAFFGFMYWLN